MNRISSTCYYYATNKTNYKETFNDLQELSSSSSGLLSGELDTLDTLFVVPENVAVVLDGELVVAVLVLDVVGEVDAVLVSERIEVVLDVELVVDILVLDVVGEVVAVLFSKRVGVGVDVELVVTILVLDAVGVIAVLFSKRRGHYILYKNMKHSE